MNDLTNELCFRPTPLKKCLFGFGLPLEKDIFFNELQSDSPKDFAKWFKKSHYLENMNDNFVWSEYKNNVSKIVKEVMENVKQLGVTVIPNFTLADLKLAKDFDVVTFFGHWLNNEEKVEFADDVHSIDEIISAIPQNTKFMLDLNVCNSVKLLDVIKKRFGSNIIVFGNIEPISLQIFLRIYEYAIQKMSNDNTLNYLDAIASTKLEFIDNF